MTVHYFLCILVVFLHFSSFYIFYMILPFYFVILALRVSFIYKYYTSLIIILDFVGYLYILIFYLLYLTLSYSLCGYLNYINIFITLDVILVLARVSLPFGNFISFLLLHKRFPRLA